MPIKILEIKGKDFRQGLSLQTSDAIGGLFQQASSYDPFYKMNRLFPTLGPTQKNDGTIAVTINAFEFYSDGTNRFLFTVGNRNVSNKSFYKINLDTDVITDLSANVHTNISSGLTQTMSVVKYWKGKVIYDQTGSGQSFRSVNPSGSSDTDILSTGIIGNYDHPSVIGPDGYVYFLNGQYIGRLVIATGTTGNNAQLFDTLDSNLIGRDIDHDGQYIFAGFDNNLNQLSGISSDCQIVIWDRFKSYAEKRWKISEAYIIGVRCLGQDCFVLTPGGWYVCSVASEPKLIYPMTSEAPFNKFPTNFNGISKNGHSIYWVDSAGTGSVFAFGNPIAGQPKILYNPYSATLTTENLKALAISGSYAYASTDIHRVYKLNSASGISTVIQSVPKYLSQPHTFSYTKIILKTAMGSGDEVSHQLNNSDDEIISGSETQNFSNVGAKKTLIFRRTATGGATINDFTDLSPRITTNCEVAGIEVYGDPMPIHSLQN